jgi:hypothetical protein
MNIEQQAKQWMKEKYKDMEMNEYQRKSVKFAIYPATHRILYPALGLAGEAGEVANKDSSGDWRCLMVLCSFGT